MELIEYADVEENVEKNDRTQRKTEDPALEQFQNEGTEIPQQGDFMDIDVSPDAQMVSILFYGTDPLYN